MAVLGLRMWVPYTGVAAAAECEREAAVVLLGTSREPGSLFLSFLWSLSLPSFLLWTCGEDCWDGVTAKTGGVAVCGRGVELRVCCCCWHSLHSPSTGRVATFLTHWNMAGGTLGWESGSHLVACSRRRWSSLELSWPFTFSLLGFSPTSKAE